MQPKHVNRTGYLVLALISVLLSVARAAELQRGDEPSAEPAVPKAIQQVLDRDRTCGGLAVHIGCGQGELAVALARSRRWVVLGLDDDAAALQVARRKIAAADLCGRVVVDHLRGRLPLVDNVVNLLVVERSEQVARDELLRVLAPGGVALLRAGDRWQKIEKPWPDDVDQWTHYLHDSSGNAVANDQRVGPPRAMQWLADPLWARYHHTLASVSSVVSAGGRLFAIIDDAPSASIDVPGRWWLVCRDAFNGILLWKKPIESWAWWRHRFRSGPVQLPRLLVTDGQRVYAPLGITAEVSILDASDGKLLATCRATKGAEEIVLHDGRLFVVVGSPISEQAMIDPLFAKQARFPNEKRIVAVDCKSGETLWQRQAEEVGLLVPLTRAATGGRVYYANSQAVVCLDAANGSQRWSSPLKLAPQGGPRGARRSKKAGPQAKIGRAPGWSVTTLVVVDDVVVLADGKTLRALDAENGNLLWQCPSAPGFRSPNDVFVINGVVWTGHLFNEGRDLRTGRVVRTLGVLPDLWTAGHHHRCYREKATCRFILTGYRGIEFVDLAGENHSRNNWVRGGCQYGILPCNGLIYAPSHACGCYMEGKLFGFWALAADSPSLDIGRKSLPVEQRLERGPAYQSADKASPSASSGDWPTYRHDILRSGSTRVELAAALQQEWSTQLGPPLTAPVVAEGLVVVCSVDRHRVVAVDTNSGQVQWEFIASGRVDSPPTIWNGKVIFGCADGYVYCLRASDGLPVWRFLAWQHLGRRRCGLRGRRTQQLPRRWFLALRARRCQRARVASKPLGRPTSERYRRHYARANQAVRPKQRGQQDAVGARPQRRVLNVRRAQRCAGQRWPLHLSTPSSFRPTVSVAAHARPASVFHVAPARRGRKPPLALGTGHRRLQ